ncbi:GNAT family N-acetyltransferase [Desmospora profundinema]|uniref:GNAT superfamily N-acetyltransferase n=1 Tax=Desmospora profundinema TaxID=1571184 RepID=A0ABU1IKT0_9BACL|nr:GNAT family N-acetyltransferase [Desmospora profundinema]MDR6225157.1 GNAT superfamily N-acetyltransferase [Desmospora profundinema]
MSEWRYELNLSQVPDDWAGRNRRYPHLRMFRLADVIQEPDTPLQLYELVREGVLHTPGHDGTFETYDTFLDRIYETSYFNHAQTQYLAADGEDWIALSSVQVQEEEGVCGLTTVRPSHRRQGIATALKSWAIADCRNRGMARLVTRIHEKNVAMRMVNERLGFRRIG